MTPIAEKRQSAPDEVELPWCDCKVAFDCEDSDALDDWLAAGGKLPPSWSLNEFDSSGARCVVIFRVEGKLLVGDGRRVEKIIRRCDANALKEKDNE